MSHSFSLTEVINRNEDSGYENVEDEHFEIEAYVVNKIMRMHHTLIGQAGRGSKKLAGYG